MAKRDSIHFNLNKIFSFNKPFMAIIGPREIGKSTTFWLWHADNWLKDHKPVVVFRRQIVDISTFYIDSIEEILHKFGYNIKFKYLKGTMKDGAVRITAEHNGKEYDFAAVFGLSCPIGRLKSLVIRNVRCGVFDEFIIDTSTGEKYLPNEAKRLKEIINTFQRECDGVFRVFFLGNPYSLYNPVFSWWGVPTNQLKRGAIITGPNWVVQCADMSPELQEYVKKHNPLYNMEDDEYTRYAFDGQAVNDANITIVDKPSDKMRLRTIFRIGGKYLCCYWRPTEKDVSWWIGFQNYDGSRDIYVFDFDNLVSNTILRDKTDKMTWYNLKNAIRTNDAVYGSLEAAYVIRDIFPLL